MAIFEVDIYLTCSFHLNKFTVIGFRLTTLEKVKQDEFRLDMAAGRFFPVKNALLDFRWVDVNLRGRGKLCKDDIAIAMIFVVYCAANSGDTP